MIDAGEYHVSKEAYEADAFGAEPTLRASLAWLLASKTAAHARWECPRLNPAYVREEKRHFDIGSVAHQILLGRGAGYDVIDADNYMTKDAKAQRDAAYAAKRTPILRADMKAVSQMCSSVRTQLAGMVDYGSIEVEPFQTGETERCIIWEDMGVWCRASLDGLSLDGDCLSEFKTEGESADPATWQWKARKMGYIFKLAFYCRGLSKLNMAHSPSARFFVAEKEPPYLLSLVRVDDELLAKENERVVKSIKLWGQCLRQNRWPGYSMDGYDLTLTERERMAEQAQFNSGHVDSETIAAGLK